MATIRKVGCGHCTMFLYLVNPVEINVRPRWTIYPSLMGHCKSSHLEAIIQKACIKFMIVVFSKKSKGAVQPRSSLLPSRKYCQPVLPNVYTFIELFGIYSAYSSTIRWSPRLVVCHHCCDLPNSNLGARIFVASAWNNPYCQQGSLLWSPQTPIANACEWDHDSADRLQP